MPYMQMTEEQFKVPVLKNVIYALRLVWQMDKRLLIGYLLQEGLYAVFSRYLQNILFLKILLDVITGSGDFRTYVGELAAFALLALVVKVAQWEGMRMEKCATKRVLKLLNDRIFEKALSVDVACYENPFSVGNPVAVAAKGGHLRAGGRALQGATAGEFGCAGTASP